MDVWFNGLGFGPALQAVLTASCQAALLALIVLVTQVSMGRWLSPRWRYALWSVVVIRLMMPVAPGSALSVFNLFRGDPVPTALAAPPVPPPVLTGMVAYDLNLSGPGLAVVEPVQVWGMDDIMLAVWLAGLAVILLIIIAINVALTFRLCRRSAITDFGLLELVESCKREMGVRRKVLLYDDPKTTSPALAGVFRPALLIPPGLLADLPREELRFILLHELAHVKKHDIAQNWLLIVLSAVHWFNPVVWFAFARLRADRELARDAMVLNTTGTNASQAYGQTIIHTLERITRPRLNNPALAGIGDGMGQLKRRLRMIAQAPKRRPALTFIGIVLLATLAAIGLTDAAEQTSLEDGATPTSTEGPRPELVVEIDDSPPGDPTRHAIDSPAPVNFFENRLVDAIDYLRNTTGANIYVNWRALSDQGVSPDTKFTLEMLGEGVTGRAALARILETVSADANEPIRYGLRGEILIVSTMADLVTARVSYPIEIPTEDHDREATTAALRKLSQPIPIQFEGNDLVHVIEYFRKKTGVDVSVNWTPLEQMGVKRDTPITLTLNDVQAREAWRLVLHQVSYFTAERIEYRVIDGVVRIGTASDLPKPPTMEEVRAEVDRLAEQNLKQPISVAFDQTPFQDVLQATRDRLGVQVFANWPYLQQAGVDAKTSVTLTLNSVPGDQALRLVLKEVSDAQGPNAPSWRLIDGVVNISLERDFMRTADTRVYDIRHLLLATDPDYKPAPLAPRADGTIPERPAKAKPSREELVGQIADLIRETVGYYEEWEARGGDISSVSELDGNLIVKTSLENHQAVEVLLSKLSDRPTTSKPIHDVPLASQEGNADTDKSPLTDLTQETNPDWRARFDAVYRLDEGQIVKHIAPPFIPDRMSYYRVTDSHQAGAIPEGPEVMFFHWDGGLKDWGKNFGRHARIEQLVNYILGLQTYEFSLERQLLKTEILGDWVYDIQADDAARRLALIRVIREATGKQLRLVQQPMERDVIVAEGVWKFTPLADSYDPRWIHIYAENEIDPNEGSGGSSGTIGEFFTTVGSRIGVRFDNQIEVPPQDRLNWGWHSSSKLRDVTDVKEHKARLRSILDNLTKQIGLTFTVERRVEDIWVISEKPVE